jgi:tRNA threonylcarbamoyladenosine biosynthesis protein TsaE
VRDPQAAARRSVIARVSASPEETEAIGAAIGGALASGDSILLTGELGAGKTTFARGVARGLGVRFGVKSPSFAIHLRYPGRLPMHHLDLYRVEDPRDLAELGLEDILERDGVAVVEWGERLGDRIPERALRIRIEDQGGSRRRLVVEGPPDLLARFQNGAWDIVTS